MKNDIVNQAKADVKAAQKANKQPKTIKIKTLIATTFFALVCLSIGAWAGITISDNYNQAIDAKVNQKVEVQLKSLKALK